MKNPMKNPMGNLLAAALIRLYPRAWRARYGEEYRALLDWRSLTVSDAFDCLRGAWDAHLRGYANSETVSPLSRAATLAVFGAWLGYVVAGMELYAVVDDSPFVPAMRAHPLFALAWQALAGGAALSLVAVLTGGTAIAVAVLNHAVTRQRSLLLLLLVPVIAMLDCIAYVLSVVAIALGWFTIPAFLSPIVTLCFAYFPTHANVMVFVMGDLIFAFSAIAASAASIVMVARSEIDTVHLRIVGIALTLQPYRLARLLAYVLALAMSGSTVAVAAWGWFAWLDAPSALAENRAEWLTVTLVMAAMTVVATTIAWRATAQRPGPTLVS